jgi:hypothetical protein
MVRPRLALHPADRKPLQSRLQRVRNWTLEGGRLEEHPVSGRA